MKFFLEIFWWLEEKRYLCTRLTKIKRYNLVTKLSESDIWKVWIRQRNSTGSGGALTSSVGWKQVIRHSNKKEWVYFLSFRSVPSKDRQILSPRCLKALRGRDNDILQWRVWSWLRRNASYRLNTCKSRGNDERACSLRRRPAHGWVTRIQPAHHLGITLRK